MSITNVEGRTVASKSLVANANTSFDVSNLNAGIYFVNVYHASGVEKVKFVKE
ncbi:MAG: T9SS type A sorting domain-containing protein [Crocinitomicaceae bacterium]